VGNVVVGEKSLKRCSRCRKSPPREAFAEDGSAGDGLRAYCRTCWSGYHQQRQSARGRNARPTVLMPRCHKCCRTGGGVKPHGAWHRNAIAPDGLATRCKTCRAARGPAGRPKRQYGLSEAGRDEAIASQKGPGVICLAAPAVRVDHCHNTGRVRGVLCFNCNSAIGKLGDDPDVVRRAAAYLEGKTWKPTLVAPGVCQLPS
jgi:hypothetical protein